VILPDVNVLLYAFRRDTARHGDHHSWIVVAYLLTVLVIAAVVGKVARGEELPKGKGT
jgi:predicted nucleic acid-binding protein